MKRSIVKRSLLLSAASLALLSGRASADNLDITTATKTAVNTANASNNSAGDITLDGSGTITISQAGAAITLNSNNNVTVEGTMANTKADDAQGILIDTGTNDTPATLTGTLLLLPSGDATTIDLTGSGTGKVGIELGGNGTFVGEISATSASMLVQGNGSYGIEIAPGSTLQGDLSYSGTIQMTPTTTNDTSAATGLAAVNIGGTVTGNVSFGAGSSLISFGDASQGVIATGAIGGSFTNYGTIETVGFQSTTNQSTGITSLPKGSGDPLAGTAVWIGNNITGGFLNAGPDGTGTTTDVAAATIYSDGGLGLSQPTLLVAPVSTATVPLEIGVYTPDTANPGFSFYNRGAITAVTTDPNTSTGAVVIGGIGPAVGVKLDGLGIFNSGSISATGSTNSSATAPIAAQALSIGSYVSVGDPANPNSGLVNAPTTAGSTTTGIISASVSGNFGGVATAIQIGTNSTLNSIVNSGIIQAQATTTNPTTVQTESAYAINDLSGTLSNITNFGSITAGATQITAGTPIQIAANLSSNTTGVNFINGDATHAALVSGDINFGDGVDTLTVTGPAPPSTAAPGTPTSQVVGNINFGGVNSAFGGQFDTLTVSDNGYVGGQIREQFAGQLNISVIAGRLDVRNNSVNYGTLLVNSLDVKTNGTLNIAVSTVLPNNTSISANGPSGTINIEAGANLGVVYSSFVPLTGQFVLLQAPTGKLDIANPLQVTTSIESNIPFLFTGDASIVSTGTGYDQLVLNLQPKTAATLGLTGYAKTLFPFVNTALANDDALGAGMIAGITDAASAQNAYSQFAPDASGGTRAIAISLTDHATGPVAARQRALRLYATQPGDLTLWGQEFAQQISDKGSDGLPGFKDSGFGFALGADGGDALGGWYGGAFTFYTGNVDQRPPLQSRDNTQWYMLTGYSTWRGKGLFLDTQLSAAYGDLSAHRFISIGGVARQSNSKHSAEMVALGMTTGANFVYGSTTITPNLAFDGLTMREEGYTETGGGGTTAGADAFDLHVDPVEMGSLRAFAGLNLRQDVNFGSFYMQPELRFGYRYDFLADRIDLTASFPSVTGTGPGTGEFTISGPQPTKGNLLAGASIAATTGAWSIGVNYDLLSGSHGSTTQVGTLSLVGRI